MCTLFATEPAINTTKNTYFKYGSSNDLEPLLFTIWNFCNLFCVNDQALFTQGVNINAFSGGSRIFLRGGGTNSKSGCVNLLFCKFSAQNCMKMWEFGPGGSVPAAPLDPPMSFLDAYELFQCSYMVMFRRSFKVMLTKTLSLALSLNKALPFPFTQ